MAEPLERLVRQGLQSLPVGGEDLLRQGRHPAVPVPIDQGVLPDLQADPLGADAAGLPIEEGREPRQIPDLRQFVQLPGQQERHQPAAKCLRRQRLRPALAGQHVKAPGQKILLLRPGVEHLLPEGTVLCHHLVQLRFQRQEGGGELLQFRLGDAVAPGKIPAVLHHNGVRRVRDAVLLRQVADALRRRVNFPFHIDPHFSPLSPARLLFPVIIAPEPVPRKGGKSSPGQAACLPRRFCRGMGAIPREFSPSGPGKNAAA